MKNTKFRKRALLSSVAMLLVALVALGSATFAWFSADPNAHTQGLQLKANSSTGLLIQSASEKSVDPNHWTHNAMFRTASINSSGESVATTGALAIGAASQDASTGTNRGIYRVDALTDDKYNANPNAEVKAATAGTDYFQEVLYLKVTGADSATVQLQKVTMNIGSTDLAKALRVAVLKSDGSVLGIFKPASATDNIYLLKASTKYSDTGVTSGTTKYSGIASGTTQTLSLGSIDNTGDAYVTVRVYLDGEDAAVKSLGIASADLTSIMSNLVMDFKAI